MKVDKNQKPHLATHYRCHEPCNPKTTTIYQVINDEHRVLAALRKVDDALGVLDANFVAVGVADHLGLVRGQVCERRLVGRRQEWIDRLDLILPDVERSGSVLDPADQRRERNRTLGKNFRVFRCAQTTKES